MDVQGYFMEWSVFLYWTSTFVGSLVMKRNSTIFIYKNAPYYEPFRIKKLLVSYVKELPWLTKSQFSPDRPIIMAVTDLISSRSKPVSLSYLKTLKLKTQHAWQSIYEKKYCIMKLCLGHESDKIAVIHMFIYEEIHQTFRTKYINQLGKTKQRPANLKKLNWKKVHNYLIFQLFHSVQMVMIKALNCWMKTKLFLIE